MGKYQPDLTMIHSTVAPGTTRGVQEAADTERVVYSPVRGKHARMESELLHYRKFIAASKPEIVRAAEAHLIPAGFRTDVFRTLEVGELSKLVETTYLGLLVGWAQEVERFAERYGAPASDVTSFMEEIVDLLPSRIFPGYIGGHCVMPNIAILRDHFDSRFLDAVVESNELKFQQLQSAQLQSAQLQNARATVAAGA